MKVARRSWSLACLLAWLSALLPAVGAAQEAQPSVSQDQPEAPGEVIVVTGSRTQGRLSQAPVPTEVISFVEMEQIGAQTLAQALDDHPGLDVVRGPGGLGVRLQGLDPRYVLILVDGQRVNGRVDGTVDLTRFSVEEIEQVEIVRGAASSLYGADAIGGVINIITRRPIAPVEADISASAGELGSADLTGGLGLRGQRGGLRLSGSWHQVDAFDLDPSDAATQGSGLRSWDAGLRGDWSPWGELELELRAEYLRRDLEGIDSNAAGAIFDRHNRTETASTLLKAALWRGQSTQLQATASYAWFRDQFLYDQRGATALDSVQISTDQQVQLGLQLNHELEDHLLTAATEGLVEHLTTPRLEDSSAQRVRGAVMLQDQWGLAEPLDLVLGTRVDADSSFGVFASPSLAARWQPHHDWILRATAGRGFRAPDFKEQWLLFENPSANYRVQGNPELDPERALSLGLHGQWTPHRQVTVDLSLFRNDIQDLIAIEALQAGDASTAAQFGYANVSRAWTQGGESHLRLSPWAGASAELSYALTQTRDVARGRPLQGRALHRAGWRLSQTYRPWGLEGSVQGSWNGPRLFFDDPEGDGEEQQITVDPYVTLDARVAWQVTPWLSLFSGGENLLNAGQAPWLPLRPRRLYAGASGRY